MKLRIFLLPFMLAALHCSAQYKVELTAPDTVYLNEPFIVAYKITGKGDKRSSIEQMKLERASSEGLVQLKEKLSTVQERITNDTLCSFRQMIYLFVPSHFGDIMLPMGRFTGPDSVKIASKQILVLPLKISAEDSLKKLNSRMLLFRDGSKSFNKLPDPSSLSMLTKVSNTTPALGEELTVSWEINSLNITPVIPSKKELEKNFTVISGPVNKGAKNNDNPTGRTKLEYTIKAKKPGKYIIKGATAKVDGKQLKSEPVEITVK
jgi:hypothetical protein